MKSLAVGLRSGLVFFALWIFSHKAFAVVLDMRAGVTEMSQRIQALHHISLWVCIVVGIVLFGAMFYSMFAHRRSKHPTPADFHESLTVEIIWTVIPVLILIVMAVPATQVLRDIEDNSDADLTVLITASQWKWHYQYVEADIGFYSNLATPQAQIDNLEPKGEHYLLEVDNPLVLPTNTCWVQSWPGAYCTSSPAARPGSARRAVSRRTATASIRRAAIRCSPRWSRRS